MLKGERASIHLRPPCKNRWSQRYLSLVRSINRRRVICFYFGQITELLFFFPSTKIIGPLLISSSVADVRTEEKEEENKKKSLIRIHTAPDTASSATPHSLEISVTFDRGRGLIANRI